MSDNAKIFNITQSEALKVIHTIIDFSAQAPEVGVVALNSYLPAYHYLVNTSIYVETAVASSGSLTFSVGFDDITTEPDNMLADEALANIDADGDLVEGIPRLGTDNTKIDIGSSDAQIAYEIKVADATAGKIVVTNTLIPYR